MTEKEYLKKIDNLYGSITAENAGQVEKELDALFAYKPVRLKWFVAKAKAMWEMRRDIGEIYTYLSDLSWGLYRYDGLEEMMDLYAFLDACRADETDETRNKMFLSFYLGETLKDGTIGALIASGNQTRRDLFEDFKDEKKARELLRIYYLTANYVGYNLLYYLLQKRNPQFIGRSWMLELVNFAWLKQCLFSEENHSFILVTNGGDGDADCEIAAKVLQEFGKKVYFLDEMLECPVDYEIAMQDTVAISMENVREEDGIVRITPVLVMLNGEYYGDNRAELVDYLIHNEISESFAPILASGTCMDWLRECPVLQKQMHRLSLFYAPGLEENLAFGWVGNYLGYISQIYEFDVEKAINAKAECDFSIVIPARNSAGTLQHTLKTCLNQRFTGTYEIVVSDNSTGGNTDVYDLCQSMNDPRIKYYKTPRDLHLPKSFEYALLQAKGEFIFSIGSDDGLFPWSLEILAYILEAFPQEEILQWDRSFYIWKGFKGGHEHKLVIPDTYEKGKLNCVKYNAFDSLCNIAKDPGGLYFLPMLYINSGFRRSYFQTLFEKTGYLINGICQDLYLGVVNSFLYKEIIRINYPITMAGMSNGSEGYKSANGDKTKEESNAFLSKVMKDANVGGYSSSATERLLPELSTDTSSFYQCLLRMVTIGLLSVDEFEKIADFKTMFTKVLSRLQPDDIMLDKKLHYAKYTAMQHSEEFGKWLDEAILQNMFAPKLLQKQDGSEKLTYKEGFGDGKSLTLDASKFGVANVNEAVKLFAKIVNL